MQTLGLNVGHDRAACVVEDGRIIVAIAEERLDRIKYSYGVTLPFLSLQYCLSHIGCTINDFDAIVITDVDVSVRVKDTWVRQLVIAGLERIDVVYTVTHHMAHAYSAYFASPFDEALVWVADGGGNISNKMQEAETAYHAKGTTLERIWEHKQEPSGTYIKKPDGKSISLGRKYEQITDRLGFNFLGHAGKTMALAAYGIPSNFGDIPSDDLIEQLKQNSFMDKLAAMKKIKLPDFRETDDVEGPWADAAAYFQKYLEEALIQRIGELSEWDNLCMAGGVSLNCVANTKIIENTNVKKWFIQPASGDDGQAIGAAYYGNYTILGQKKRHMMRDAYLGRQYDGDYMYMALRSFPQFQVLDIPDLEKYVAAHLEAGKIVGWFQGGSEMGPRALGHRSILAHPGFPDMKYTLNRRIKHRELFRPFAPIVKAGEISRYFDWDGESPFMLLAMPIKEKWQEHLTAVAHVDQSSRAQTISAVSNLRLFNLLSEFQKVAGFPVLLNTSFNVDGQPIVETPEDALRVFALTDIDLLVLNDVVVTK